MEATAMAGSSGKYAALKAHLRQKAKELSNTGGNELAMTFAEIEALGVALPPSAYKHHAWWADRSYSRPWSPQFWPRDVDLEKRRLKFHYAGPIFDDGVARPKESERGASSGQKDRESPMGMSDMARNYASGENEIRNSGECRHPLYGRLQGHIRLVAGLDLTEPADPEWGERIWGEDKDKR
jgi:hypothetical protein